MKTQCEVESKEILGVTESVCPVCLKRIAAEGIAEGDAVYLRKVCAEHGQFKTVLWRGRSSFQSWGGVKGEPSRPPA